MTPRLKSFLFPSWEQRKRLLVSEARVLLIASYAALLFAYLFPQNNRNASPAYTLFAWAAILTRTLQFHLGLLVLVVAAALAYARRRYLFLSTLPLLLFTLAPAALSYRPKQRPAVPAGSPTLKVMTANLLMVNHDTAGIINEIQQFSPDVLLLQEYTDHWHRALQQSIGPAYPHITYVPQDDSFGTAIYSKLPFTTPPDKRLHMGREPLPQMRTTIQFAGREVALYNIHLLPPRRLDYTIEHRQQLADLCDLLRGEQLPIILAGDFNFTETTPQAREVARLGLRDAHDLAGFGRSTTWPVNSFFRYLPALRFDHLYLSPGLTATTCETGIGQGSDHRPVLATVSFLTPNP